MSHKTIKIGIIGLGNWGRNYVRIFGSNNKVKILKICDKKKINLTNIILQAIIKIY